MAWPFSTVDEPNLNTGTGQAVPTSSTAITALDAWLLGAHFTNQSDESRHVTVTNTAGAVLCELDVPPAAEMTYEWPFRPTLGVKWFADGVDVVGHVWGYE